jgi:hypothetical protein
MHRFGYLCEDTQDTLHDLQEGLDTMTCRVTDHRSYMTLIGHFIPSRFPNSCSKEIYQCFYHPTASTKDV